uniref:Uncharacterized protein n=1 Tax=Mycena chlorophos TaxID=658473 RepID=A0ABQ0LUW0_MYCCL|nr:predicted protein [Mycena chlorophos]
MTDPEIANADSHPYGPFHAGEWKGHGRPGSVRTDDASSRLPVAGSSPEKVFRSNLSGIPPPMRVEPYPEPAQPTQAQLEEHERLREDPERARGVMLAEAAARLNPQGAAAQRSGCGHRDTTSRCSFRCGWFKSPFPRSVSDWLWSAPAVI